MIRIDVDYNARDSEGHVVTRVPEAQRADLSNGQRVSLYDPVDRLWADAVVVWIDPTTGAVGFDVDWTSFVDGDFLDTEEPRNELLVVYSRTYSNEGLTWRCSAHLTPMDKVSTVKLYQRRARILSRWFGRPSTREREPAISASPVIMNFAIHLAPVEHDPYSSSSAIAELGTKWELADR